MGRPSGIIGSALNRRKWCRFSPPLTDEQLAQFKRAPKVLVAARIDKEVYDWLMKYGKGYSTPINGILRRVMEGTR
jgi:uncharacterized protein (DUF4415 family)